MKIDAIQKQTRSAILVIVFLICSNALVCAEVPDTVRHLTLTEALTIAEENNANLQSLAITRDSAARQYSNSWNTFLPALSLSGNYANTHDLSNDVPSEWQWTAGGGINLGLEFSAPAKIQQRKITAQAADIAYNKARTELYNSVVQSFYSLIADGENIALQKDSLEQAEAQYKKIQAKYASGLSSELDLLNARYAVESQKPEIARLEASFRYGLNTFCVTIGLDYTQSIILDGKITVTAVEIPDVRECIARYASNRFDIQTAENALETARNQATITKIGTLAPSINLSEQIVCKEKDSNITVGGTFTAAVSIPLTGFIPNSAENLTMKEKDDAVKTATLNLVNTKNCAEIDIANKAADVTRILGSISAAKLNTDIAVRTWELAQDSFKNGLIDQKDFEDYRIKKVAAQQSLLQTQISYITAVNTLANALGILPEELYRTYSINTSTEETK